MPDDVTGQISRQVRRKRAWAMRLLRGVLGAILLFFAIAHLAVFLPALPWSLFGMVAGIFCFGLSAWLILLAIGGLLLWGRAWRRDRRRGAAVLAGASLFVLVGAGVILASQYRLARANAVSLSLAQALWPGPVAHAGPPAESVIYDRFRGQRLPVAVYRPAPNPSREAAPVLVYLHGGGWIGLSYTFRAADMRWLADRGFLVISVEYSLSTETLHLWNVVQPQVGCALAWVARNAGRYGGDADRIAMLGDSAGGNLVLTTSYMAAQGRLRSDCGGRVPKIAATVAIYPVADVADFHGSDASPSGGRQMARAYLGGTPQQFPDRYAAVSPGTYISRAAPPTLLIVGDADALVRPGGARRFAAKASAAGVPVRSVIVPHAGHGFDLISGSLPNQFVRVLTDRFLKRRT